MWYTCFSIEAYNQFNGQGSDVAYYVGYTESEDGYRWTKPELDGFAFGEYERTNILCWQRVARSDEEAGTRRQCDRHLVEG